MGDFKPFVDIFILGIPEIGCWTLEACDFDDEVEEDVDGRGDGVVGSPIVLGGAA